MYSISPQLTPWLLSIAELLLLLPALAMAFFRAERKAHHFARRDGWFGRLARRRSLASLSVAAFVLIVRAALIPLLGIPAPAAHDEFSYLLAADTFAHGRITNPVHPMWVHFETFHVIQHPTYMSMYPPAQGLVLAAGQLLGHPWIGQWLITGILCGAICWMLQAWMPAEWALLGACIAALRLGILSYWMNGYWSASIVALGGVLLFGTWPRLNKYGRLRHAAWLAFGLIILANSRPYEGLIVSLPVAFNMLLWIVQKKSKPEIWSAVALIAAMLAVGGAAAGYYYYRVTGSPFRMTYEVNRGTYAMAPYFIWEKSRPEPVYHHAILRQLYRRELREFQANETFDGYLFFAKFKFESSWRVYLGPILTLPLFAFPWVLRDRRMRFPLYAMAFFLLGLSLEVFVLPHYLSPALGLMYILLLQSMRHMQAWRLRGKAVGAALVRFLPVLCLAMVILRLTAVATGARLEAPWPRGNMRRVRVIEQLQHEPGPQLVIVRYEPDHYIDVDDVYNSADIDSSKIVWARDMGDQNAELLRYYSNRRAWLFDVGDRNPRLQPYPDTSATPPALTSKSR